MATLSNHTVPWLTLQRTQVTLSCPNNGFSLIVSEIFQLSNSYMYQFVEEVMMDTLSTKKK